MKVRKELKLNEIMSLKLEGKKTVVFCEEKGRELNDSHKIKQKSGKI